MNVSELIAVLREYPNDTQVITVSLSGKIELSPAQVVYLPAAKAVGIGPGEIVKVKPKAKIGGAKKK